MKYKSLYLLILYAFLGWNVFSEEAKLKFQVGVPPWAGEYGDVINTYNAVLDYISEKTDIELELVVEIDYDSIGKNINDGKLDIGILPSTAYVKAKQRYKNILYLCSSVGKREKKSTYSSNIVVKKGGDITNFQDLKDKYFAYVDEDSSSGYLFPKAEMLVNWKINPDKYFKKILFLGTHKNVLDAIYDERADAGAVSQHALSCYTDKHGDVFEVLETINDIPFDAVIISKKMDVKLQKKIKKTLLEIDFNTTNKTGNKVLNNFFLGGFLERDDAYYDVVRTKQDILIQ